jgi:S1-C subfamily serine protease
LNDEHPSRTEIWRQRARRLGARIRRTLPFVWGVLAAFLALWTYHQFFPGPAPLTTADVKNTYAQIMASATAPPSDASLVYQVIQPSVVLIQTKGTNTAGQDDGGLGTGVIVNDTGAILTALHVVTQSTEIDITFADGTKSPAVIVNVQPQNDIAVLQASQPPGQIVPATLGNANALRVGDEAFVVGNPLGLYSSMSAGVISGLERSFAPPNGPEIQHLIQVDAAVNPGNSGGPLLNRAGQVVGIVTALINPTKQDVFIGIGLAVPISSAASGAGLPPD